MKVYCFNHPGYSGCESPDLQCQSCCEIFIEKIKELNRINPVNAEEKSQKKIRERRQFRQRQGSLSWIS